MGLFAGTQQSLFVPAPTTIPRTLYSDLPGEASNKPLRGKRLGVDFAWVDGVDLEVGQAFKRVLRLAADLGCKVFPHKRIQNKNVFENCLKPCLLLRQLAKLSGHHIHTAGNHLMSFKIAEYGHGGVQP